ncbi:MAG: calcium-binding protein [Bradymonadaceae bacterium]
MREREDADLDAIIERSFVDAYDEEERALGLAITISDGIQPPFSATVVGVDVEVVESTHRNEGLYRAPAVVCEREGEQFTVSVLELEDWSDAEGARFIAAYRTYCGLEPWEGA